MNSWLSPFSRRSWMKSLAALPVAGGALHAAGQASPAQNNALRSRAAEALPITFEERQQRVARAQQLMQQTKLNAIVLTSGTSFNYFTGFRWGGGERMLACVIPARGEMFFIIASFEHGRAMEQIEVAMPGAKPETYKWEEDESPFELVIKQLAARSLSTGAIGVDESMPFVFSDGLAQALGKAGRIVSATLVTAGCRMIKTEHELTLMRIANEATLAAYASVWPRVKPGVTHRQISEWIAAAMQQQGFRGYAMVLVNEASALPHGTVKPQVVRENSVVLIDGGCMAQGYEADISRTFVVGKPTEKQQRVFEIVREAQKAALDAAKPGAACGAPDAAARKVIADAGYGPGYKYFTHRLGHGIGMDGHEWAYLLKGNPTPLRPGMCFSNEPGIYMPGEFGVRLEDCIYITDAGAQYFTPPQVSLEQPF